PLARTATSAPIAFLAVFAIAVSIRFYQLVHANVIRTDVPFPFSALVSLLLAFIAWRIVRPTKLLPEPIRSDMCEMPHPAPSPLYSGERAGVRGGMTVDAPCTKTPDPLPRVQGGNQIANSRFRFALTFLACAIAFPLAQIFFFGHTDYRRSA